MTPVGYLVKRIGQDHSELRFKPPADLPFNRKNWTWEPVFLSPIPSPDSRPEPEAELTPEQRRRLREDSMGLIEADMRRRADEIDHAGNKDSSPWSDDLRRWAAALSRLQARAEQAEADLTAAQETNQRLNRRVQVAERFQESIAGTLDCWSKVTSTIRRNDKERRRGVWRNGYDLAVRYMRRDINNLLNRLRARALLGEQGK